MDQLTLFRTSPRAFIETLVVQKADGALSRFGECMAPFQRETFDAIGPALVRVSDPEAPPATRTRLWAERLRGSSKTTDVAALSCWALLFAKLPIHAVVVAADKDQAGILAAELSRIINLNKAVGGFLKADKWRISNKRTGSDLEIMTSDAPSSYGTLADLFVLEEVSHWKSDEMWTSMISAAAKKPNAVVLCLLNAGWKSSWVWPVRESVRTDPAWIFAQQTDLAPWISESAAAEQRRLIPAVAYDRLWRGLWADGSGGDAFDAADIDAINTLPGPVLKYRPGWRSVCGLDLGTRRDSTAAVVLSVHVGGVRRVEAEGKTVPVSRIGKILADIGPQFPPEPEDIWNSLPVVSKLDATYKETAGSARLQVCEVRVWKPRPGRRVSLKAVRDWLIAAHKRHRFIEVCMDPHEGERLAEELREAGLKVRQVAQQPGQLAQQSEALWDAVTRRRLRLYDDPDLIADLKSARIMDNTWGWRITHERKTATAEGTGHGDTTTALSIAVHTIKRFRKPAGPRGVNRPLVY
ncbi:MAG: terminase large subunit domain-containing protein [Thermoguttaceae bacterium]